MGHSRRTSVQNYTGFDFTVLYINVIVIIIVIVIRFVYKNV